MEDRNQQNILTAEEISFCYPSSSSDLFRGLTLAVRPNETVGILGESGSGKTTLLKLLSGLETPTSGKITRFCPTQGSFVFQAPVLLDWLTVEKNITFPGKPRGQDHGLEELLHHLGLSSARGKFPRELSGGMRSRVQLARALHRNPEVLFLDEPFSGLDEKRRYQLNELLMRVQSQYQFSALVVSHSVEEAVFLSDRLFVLKLQAPDSPVSVEEVREGLEFSRSSLDVLDTLEFRQVVARIRDSLFSMDQHDSQE